MPTKNTPPRAYAYELELGDGLCHWAEPTRERLERRSLPSPGAKIVPVRIVPEGRYRELLKMEREAEDGILVELVGKARRQVIAEARTLIAVAHSGEHDLAAQWHKNAQQWLGTNAPAAEEGEGEA